MVGRVVQPPPLPGFEVAALARDLLGDHLDGRLKPIQDSIKDKRAGMAYETFVVVVVVVVQVVVVIEARTRPTESARRVFVFGVVSIVDVFEVSLLSDGKALDAVGQAPAARIEIVLVVIVRVRAGAGLEGFARTGGIRGGTLP